MNRAGTYLGTNQTGPYLHQTARISGRNPRRTGRADVGELGLEHGVRSFRLNEIVDARASAALIGILEWNQLQFGNRGKNRERRLRHPLRMLEMTRRVVGDFDGKRSTLARPGGSEKLTHITYARAQSDGTLVPFGIISQQV